MRIFEFCQRKAGDQQTGVDALQTPDPGQHADRPDPHMGQHTDTSHPLMGPAPAAPGPDSHPGTQSPKSMPYIRKKKALAPILQSQCPPKSMP